MKKFFIILLSLTIMLNNAKAETLAINFFADEQSFNIKERKKLVRFLKEHKQNNKYEFELLTLSDPIGFKLDNERTKKVQALFREYGVNIEGLLSAKIKFIASDKQQLLIIRK